MMSGNGISPIRRAAIIRTILFFMAVSAIGAPCGAEQKIICDFCKREITDSKYISVNDKYFHADHFFCRECAVSLVDKQFYAHEGKYYCEKCYESKFVPRCAYCDKYIKDKFIKFEQKIYHEECYFNHVAQKCVLCRETIKGEYVVDFWGNKYHKHHQDNTPRCIYCGRLICDNLTRGGTQYADGRHVCGLCLKGAINDQSDASRLMTSVSRTLDRFGINTDPANITLQLVDKNRMSELSPNNSNRQAGLTKFESSTISGKIVSKKFYVYILRGMPELVCNSTLVHELMHVWLYDHAPIEMDPALTEGSCNYASYLYLQNDRSQMADYILKNMEEDADLFYGEGYRRIRKYINRVGIQAWLEFLKSNKNFPPGY